MWFSALILLDVHLAGYLASTSVTVVISTGLGLTRDNYGKLAS